MKWVWCTFNLTNVELNMRCKCLWSFIPHVGKVFGTCVTYILHDRKSCDGSCATWVSHKSKEVWGAFKVIPTILMHHYSGMLDSDLKRIEGQKESCMRTKIASMTCKSIATWRTYEFLKVQQIKNSEELLKRNEEIVLPLFCMTWSYE